MIDRRPILDTDDVNALVAGYLRDLAFAQPTRHQMFGFKRAAAAVFALEVPLPELTASRGPLPRIHGIGPASWRVIHEVLETGVSPTAERAIEVTGRRSDIERRRSLRQHFFSRAKVLHILRDLDLGGPRSEDYRGDLQMHSDWSDGDPRLDELSAACQARGYVYAAVTDHSHGLKIAGGMSMREAADQRREIERINADSGDRFRLLQGVEANIGPDGALDLSPDEAATFELVLAAPHSLLRKLHDQTHRLVVAVQNPAVRILGHPRGRIAGSRAGVVADWGAVFGAAARTQVAIELDGDPSRQDLDYTLARQALDAGCLFALDSDAHATNQLTYVETALAHARLAGIPCDRIVNCWPFERFHRWLYGLARPARER